MSEGQIPEKIELTEEDMKPAVDKLFRRLNLHEQIAIQDNQGPEIMAGEETLGSAIERMKKEMVSTKDTLLKHLETMTEKIDWKLPQNLKERVAAGGSQQVATRGFRSSFARNESGHMAHGM